MRSGKRTAVEMAVVGVVASAVGIALGLVIDWFPESASTQAGPIDTLWDVLLVVSIPVFVLVTVIVVFAVRDFRVQPGQERQDGPPIHGNTRLEVIWTAVPSALIAVLVVYAYLVLNDIEKAPANAGQELRVKVVGQQFTWTFEYPQEGGKPIRSNQLYLPIDRSVRFDIEAKDVLHSFWVPEFRMKIDAVPGITTNFRVTPNKLGTYPVVCAELCGIGHAFMRQSAHVLRAADFEKWLDEKSAPAGGGGAGAGGETADAADIDAKALFVEGNGTATACGGCHKLADAGTAGGVGPDLDQALAGQDVAAVVKSIVEPDADVPEGFQAGIMPKDYGQTMSRAELDALAEYLVEVTSK